MASKHFPESDILTPKVQITWKEWEKQSKKTFHSALMCFLPTQNYSHTHNHSSLLRKRVLSKYGFLWEEKLITPHDLVYLGELLQS